MAFATIHSDVNSDEWPILRPNGFRPTAVKSAILALGIVLCAAAIAACVTVISEWVDAAYLKPNNKPKVAVRSELARESKQADAVVATTPRPSSAFLFKSPFAHLSGLLFLSEPVGSAALLQDQASGTSPAERPSAGIVVGAALPSSPSDEQQTEIPLPRSRPPSHKDIQATSVAANSATDAATSQTSPSAALAFLEKIFHFWKTPNDTKLPPEVDYHTAVYDIEGHIVYLPTGEKLEAHSGMGKLIDDVRYVKEKGRGPTPPNVYHLVLRKSLFHGVQAIRLNPVDTGKMYGREGMLAHPYMLGPDGQSNGCISVQDYPKFLEAFLSGKIDRLIVVPKLTDTPSYAANAFARDDKQYASQ
jgi:Tlde1 domain